MITGYLIPASTDTMTKPNHSPVWEHAGYLWMAMQRPDGKTTIRRRDGVALWTDTGITVHDRQGDRIDTVMDSATGRVYVMASHGTSNRMTTATYSSGAWVVENNKVAIPGITGSETSALGYAPGLLVVAQWVTGQKLLRVNWSTSAGSTWQASPVAIADATRIGSNTSQGLVRTDGLPDLCTWSEGGETRMGILIGEDPNVLHFLRLTVGNDPGNAANWIYETMPAWYADDHVSIIAGVDGTLYGFVKSAAAEPSPYAAVKRALGGTWSLYQTTMQGRRPGVQLDAATGLLYCVASYTDVGHPVTYRTFDPSTSTFGTETTLIESDADNLHNGGGSHLPLTGGTLVFVAGNMTDGTAWAGEVVLQAPPREETVTLALVDGQVVDLLALPEDLGGLHLTDLVLTSATGCVLRPSAIDGFPLADGDDGVQARAGGTVTVDYAEAGSVVGTGARWIDVVGNGDVVMVFRD